jgi:hypothetical protein
MTAEEKKNIEDIRKKVELGEDLTPAEEFLYLTKVMGHNELQANTVITIAENKDENVLID